jgi:TfoX/Sxy family transcriptional regulator of competence genes
MAYDEELAERIRQALDGESGISEQRMFGGLGFMVHGNMAVAASGQGGLLVRIDPADAETLTEDTHVRRMEMRGKQMDGWLRFDAEAAASLDDLQRWVDTGLDYARSLPPK